MRIAAVALTGTLTGMLSAVAWAQAPAAGPQYKPGEDTVVTAIQKETDGTKKVALLKDWEQKFPDSDFKGMRAVMIIQTEAGAVGNATKANTPAAMAAAEPMAKDLADNLDNYFSDSNRQPTTTAEQWAAAKTGVGVGAHTLLATLAFGKKTPEGDATAEAEYKKLMALSPTTGFYSYQLGTLILREKKIERIPEGLFYIARGVQATGQGALPATMKGQAETYLQKAYEGYHGDANGLDDLKKVAMASAAPPAGFAIKSVVEADKEKQDAEAKFNAEHPDLALWHQVRDAVTADGGQAYFDSSIKDAGLPPGDKFKFFTVKLVEQKSPKELLVSVENPKGDALLTFLDPLKGTIEVGTEFKFKGGVDSFTKDPYVLTFKDMDKDDVEGLPESLFAAASTPKPKKPAAKKK